MGQKIKSTPLDKAAVMNSTRVPILSKLSHELKTPIHGISGISSYLQDNWNEMTEEGKLKCVSAIIEASDSLTSILNSMLDNLHEEEKIKCNFARINLIETIRLAIEKCKNLYLGQNQLNIIFEPSLEVCKVDADSFWITQLLTNLLSNAIKYANCDRITIYVKTENVGEREYCIVSVQDEGVGIAEEELENIFAPFNRGSMGRLQKESTGLGLAICREIVEAHGGRIFAKNNPDKGVTIEFSIAMQR
ncbi:MAG: hypothetical protein Tsb006_0160 [Rickettsiaceae bacterium]